MPNRNKFSALKSVTTSLGGPASSRDATVPPNVFQELLEKYSLIGREVCIQWHDSEWYEAVVVCYYTEEDSYKLVYRADDAIEVTKLGEDVQWYVLPKKRPIPGHPVLDGALVEFKYPLDGKRYSAIVYDYSKDCAKLKIAYTDHHGTDVLKGGGWDFITSSPCLNDSEIGGNISQHDHESLSGGVSIRQSSNQVERPSKRFCPGKEE